MRTTTLQGKITGLTRFDTSTMGNPRYQFVIAGEILYTEVNGMLGYGIANYEGLEVIATVRYIRNKLTITNIQKV